MQLNDVLLPVLEQHLKQESSAEILFRSNLNGQKGALHVASQCGDKKVVRMLLEYGANINGVGEYGRTPLHYALLMGNGDTAEKLCRSGANVTKLDDFGHSPVQIALAHGSPLSPIRARRIFRLSREKPGDEESSESVPAVINLTYQDFLQSYVAMNRPVLVRGEMDGWPSLQDKFSVKYLRKLGDLLYPIRECVTTCRSLFITMSLFTIAVAPDQVELPLPQRLEFFLLRVAYLSSLCLP